jgi:predicted ATP-grasp superfamily ATP-dependent carboligase
MNPQDHLLIFGAGTRAAAFSALRAGLRPWCADLFQDADLQAHCPSIALPRREYPKGFLALIRQAPPGPWMYTGGLENRRSLIRKLAAVRPLWGNNSAVLAVIRSPQKLAGIFARAGFSFPSFYCRPQDIPKPGRWLIKPFKGSGGTGITFYAKRAKKRNSTERKHFFFQEFIDGDSCAAAYVSDGRKACLLGVTRQLVGEPWLHAAPFHYCGSVGPLSLSDNLRQTLERCGNTLVEASGLKGLFGIDFILKGDTPWLLEINPRYTASLEVIEYGLNVPIMALHRAIFDPSARTPPISEKAVKTEWIGKGILFARQTLTFPGDGPWQGTLQNPPPVEVVPPFADIPLAGQAIAKGWPILTVFAKGNSLEECVDVLRRTTRDLDHWLFGK